jgi:hypothetical protein
MLAPEKEDTDQIFGNLPKLLSFHQDFLKALEAKTKNYATDPNLSIGDIFLENFK